MMHVPTITSFARALMAPQESFASLKGFTVEQHNGSARVCRTALFSEVHISIGSARYLLCAPVRPDSFEHIAEPMALVQSLRSGALSQYEILPHEFTFHDSERRRRRCDLLLHGIPEGEQLDEAVTHVGTGRLLAALELLKEEFIRLGVRHRNFKPENLIYGSDGRLYPIRYHYMVEEPKVKAIETEFRVIEEFIRRRAHGDGDEGGYLLPPSYDELLDEAFDEVFPMHDMMCMVRRGKLYGYADAVGRTVVEPKFAYAEHFCENRAVVQLKGLMGVIDREGREIVEIKYDMVRMTAAGNLRVMKGKRVGEFDYNGVETVPLQTGLDFNGD